MASTEGEDAFSLLMNLCTEPADETPSTSSQPNESCYEIEPNVVDLYPSSSAAWFGDDDDDEDYDDGDDDEGQESDDDDDDSSDYEATARTRSKSKKKSKKRIVLPRRRQRPRVRKSNKPALVEDKFIDDDDDDQDQDQDQDEPIQMDLRKMNTVYGINPLDPHHRKQAARKFRGGGLDMVIGEAYVKQNLNKTDEAIRLLVEFIRFHPQDSKLYQALGEIYYKDGQVEKALEFYFIACTFTPNDHQSWANLADLALAYGKHKLALDYFLRATKASPKNISYQIKRCNVLETTRQYDQAIKQYEKLIHQCDPVDQFNIILSIIFRAMNLISKQMKNPQLAQNVIEVKMREYDIEHDPSKFQSFYYMYMCQYFDVLFKNGHHKMVLQKFKEYGILKIDCDDTQDWMACIIEAVDSVFGDYLKDIDRIIKSKLFCIFIYEGQFDLVRPYLEDFLCLGKDLQSKIYPQLIEALLLIEKYEQAYECAYSLTLVNQSSETSNESEREKPSTLNSMYYYWCGLCQRKMGNINQAIAELEKSIEGDAHNYSSLELLGELCNLVGLPERALDNFNNVENILTYNTIDVKIVKNQCNLLYTCKRWEEFVTRAKLLLNTEMYLLENLQDPGDMFSPTMTRHSVIKTSRTLKRKYSKRAKLVQITKNGVRLSEAEFVELLRKVLHLLVHHLKNYHEAIRLAFSAFLSSYYPRNDVTILLFSFRCCYEARLKHYTFDLCRMLVKEFPDSGMIWYSLSVVMNDIYGNLKHKKFCLAICRQHEENMNALLMNANIALTNGRYKEALCLYMVLYKKRTTYKYDSFHVALCYLHLLSQSNTMDKCSLFNQMLFFIHDYMDKVGKCQEFYYNFGRACHQLGMLDFARQLYEVALATPIKVYGKRFDLSPEIAFNLGQIYRAQGKHGKANELITCYCTI